MSLQTKCVLVSLNITQWTAQKFDKKATKRTTELSQADGDAGRFNKHLIHKDALRKLRDITTATRAFHYNNTLPWHEAQGTRILPVRAIPKYTEYMRKAKLDFEDAKRQFITHYPAYVEHARTRLGDLFDVTDFPNSDEIESRFAFRTAISPVPHHGDFRVEIPAADLDAIQKDLQDRMGRATEEAKRDLWRRTSSVLDSLYTTLADPNKRIFESTVHGNIVGLLDQMRNLNFDNDPNLEETAKLIAEKLGKLSPAAIKEDETFRQEALDKTDEIMRKMAGFMGHGA